MQVEVLNHPKVLRAKAGVLSVWGKGGEESSGVCRKDE
jgi:hypothetical protein